MTPKLVSPSSQRVIGDSAKYAFNRASRSITTPWRGRACAGIITFFDGFSMKARVGGSLRSPSTTGLRVCESRVVERTITGVSKVSESSNASRVNSSASWASLGSSTGTVASAP